MIHFDNGSPMNGATMLETLYVLGITPSKSRPRVSNDNSYAESIFKTLKYRPNYQPKSFEMITEARLWVKHFVDWYNNEQRHSEIQYVTPAERHEGKDKDILKRRHELYEAAKAKHPERGARTTRNWEYREVEWINPERSNVTEKNNQDVKAS